MLRKASFTQKSEVEGSQREYVETSMWAIEVASARVVVAWPGVGEEETKRRLDQ